MYIEQATISKKEKKKIQLFQDGGQRLLAVVFVAVIFYVGTARFPSTIANIGNLLKDGETGIAAKLLSVRDALNSEYSNMLDTKGVRLKNKNDYLDLNGLMARIMGQRYMNDTLKLNNGHLQRPVERLSTGQQEIAVAADQITKVYNRQKKRGKYFLYVLAPFQMPKYEDILPLGYTDTSNPNADYFVSLLRENDVPVLDLREVMHSEGIDHSEAFFITDHHWTPETGFWAYTKIINHLVQAGVMDPVPSKYTDAEEFNTDVFKAPFLGSGGRETGKYFADTDKLAVVTPKFETNLSVEILSASISRQGPFAETAFTIPANQVDYLRDPPGLGYGFGDQPQISYRNQFAPIDLKVLSWGDSFTNYSLTFLPLVFSVYEELDMRHFKGDFEEHYNEFDPDIVIVLLNAEIVYSTQNIHDFFGDLQE